MNILMIERGEYISDIRIRREAESLVEAGHNVHIVCAGQYDGERQDELNGVKITRICPRNKITHNTHEAINKLTFYQPYWTYKIKNILDDGDFDILHYHDIPPSKFSTRLAQYYDLQIIADLHEMYPEAVKLWRKAYTLVERLHPKRVFDPPWRYKRLEKFAVENTDALITVSEEMKDHFVNKYDFDGLSGVVRNVPDLERLDQMPPGNVEYDEDIVISYIGGFTPQRGIERVIKSIPAVIERFPNTKLVLVGDGADSYVRSLKSLCDDLNILDHVTFEGWVDFEQIRSYYESSTVTVIPYYHREASKYALPNKIFQAMAFKTPVIVSNLPTMKKIVDDTESGITVNETGSFAEAVIELSEDTHRRKKLSDAGREAVEDEYNISTEIKDLLEIVEQLG